MPKLEADGINASTRFCAVYGHPIRHSASPAMHNAAVRHLGLNWRYLAFDVRPEHLAAAIAGARRMHFIGLNLTVPHKLLAVPLVDALDEAAREWGAVNTIRFEGLSAQGNWEPLHAFDEAPSETRSLGCNTDADAIVRALREDLRVELRAATVLILGAGGAGRTTALKLAAEGAGALFLVNRTATKAKEVQSEIEKRFPSVQVITGYPSRNVDLVVNATSLGLKPDDPLPLDQSAFGLSRAGAAYDMIYRPAETRFLELARAAGCKVANGLGMLLYQGARALEIWAGVPAPIDVMRRALEANVYG